MKAVIMAGGFGTRIQPLTSSLPKPMLPLMNRPIMLHIIELLKRHDITELVILLYHQPYIIKSFFGDGSEFGVRISYVTPLQDMGTAGAVKAAAKFLTERFLIISGDLLTDFNLDKVIKFHEENGAMATITLTSVKDPLQFGVVITDKKNRIIRFLEKPGWGEVISDTVNTGIYVLEPEILELIPEGENFDFSQNLFPALLEKQLPLFGVTAKGYWRDIGNPESYREAHSDIFKGRTTVHISERCDADAGNNICLGADVRLDPHARLSGMVVIGDNSQISGNAQIRESVIGRNCNIEAGCKINRCIIWDNSYIKKGARLSDAVICNNVQISKDVTVEEGVIVAEHTVIGEEATINRDVKIWPRKLIEPGSTVTGNLIWGEKWKKLLFEGAIVKGLTNVELTPEFVARLGCAFGSTLPKGSFILAGRDAALSSRMLKRSFIGGILSAGVNVRDLKMISPPVIRYKLNTFGESGGIYVRQSADDPAMSEILFLDADGLNFSGSMGKNVERIFFKENFRRVHFREPGSITELPHVIDFYREGFLRQIDISLIKKRNPKIVVDFNFSPAGQLLPMLLNDLGCEVISLNAYVDEERGARVAADKPKGLLQLSKIVTTLEACSGFWIDPDGEQITVIGDNGRVYEPSELLPLLVSLIPDGTPQGFITVPVSAPSAVEILAARHNIEIRRTKSGERAMIEAGLSRECLMICSMEGQIAFPPFHPAFDGMFAIARIMELLTASETTLSATAKKLPRRSFLQARIPCPWEMKGGIMRKMSEDSLDKDATFIDGIKLSFGSDWLLLLPDQYRSFIHLVAEARETKTARNLISSYRDKIERWKKELGVS